MNKLISYIWAVVALLFAMGANAGMSEVTWSDPDSYRDVHAGEGHRAKFKARVFAEFEKHFAKLATKLPAGHKLVIDVKDVDLAGDVHQGGVRRIRIVKDIFYPRIKFSYQLLDSDNQLLAGDEINLKDMNFLFGASLKYNHDILGYEKRMLDDWFKERFSRFLQ